MSFEAYCKVSISPVRADASDASEIVTQLLFGELITVQEINEPWARITTHSDAYSGFIDYKHLSKLTSKEVRRWNEGLTFLDDRERTIKTPWGIQRICRGSFVSGNKGEFNIGEDHFTFLDEPKELPNSIYEYAKDYINTPYLWGGKSPYGIDCSGITQVIYRLFGINLPRDASQQVDIGSDVDFEDQQAGDLAYFSNNEGKVTHVGILSGEGKIIHAAGHVREDIFNEQGIIRKDNGILSHRLTCIKRV